MSESENQIRYIQSLSNGTLKAEAAMEELETEHTIDEMTEYHNLENTRQMLSALIGAKKLGNERLIQMATDFIHKWIAVERPSHIKCWIDQDEDRVFIDMGDRIEILSNQDNEIKKILKQMVGS